MLFFILEKLLCIVPYFILLTEQLVLCGSCRDILYTDNLAAAEKVKMNVMERTNPVSAHGLFRLPLQYSVPRGSQRIFSQNWKRFKNWLHRRNLDSL